MYSNLAMDDKVGLALAVFRRYDTAPGGGLPSNVFVVAAARAGAKGHDMKLGLEMGVRRKWFAIGNDGIVTLTSLGFDQL